MSTTVSTVFGLMKNRLFNPFSLRHWFLLGFSAWLVVLYKVANQVIQSFQIGYQVITKLSTLLGQKSSLFDIESTKQEMLSWFIENTLFFLTLGIAIILLILVLLWVSSIAEFIFLDNLALHASSAFSKWNLFSKRGSSLFLWRVGINIASIISILIFLAIGISTIWLLFGKNENQSHTIPIFISIFCLATVVIAILALFSFLRTLLSDFVIPFMYRYNLPCSKAIGYTGKLFRVHWPGFIIFWVGKELIRFGVHFALFVIVLCSLFLVLAPYALPIINIGWDYLIAVCLLPISVFFRLLGPIFLAQLNPDYQILQESDQGEAN